MKKYTTIIEIGLAVLSVLGFLLRLQGLSLGAIFMMGGLGGLCLLYLLELIYNLTKAQAAISIRNLANLAAAFATVGLLFKLMLWLPLDTLLRYALYGFLLTILGLLFHFRVSQKVEDIRYYRKALQRSLIIAATAFLIYITPARQLVNRYYAQDSQEIQKQYQRLKIESKRPDTEPSNPSQ